MKYKLFIAGLEKEFRKHANKFHAAGAKAYMRDQFEYIGLSTPDRRKIMKNFLTGNELPPYEKMHELVRQLWLMEEREFQYAAMELCFRFKKKFRKNDLALFEWMILNKSWWDTVDFITPKLVQYYFHLYPDKMIPATKRWLKSDNTWLIRSAIIFQLHPAEKVNEEILFGNIRAAAHHQDFFVRKAIGWALRQYSKKNPKAVKKFISETKLSPLSVREGSKYV